MLDFLELNGYYSEEELEDAIAKQLEAFILELGQGFAFLERQKRFTIDGTDYYLDLLFYHRKLKCLVAIDLKLGKFKRQAAFIHRKAEKSCKVTENRGQNKRNSFLFYIRCSNFAIFIHRVTVKHLKYLTQLFYRHTLLL